MKADKLFRRWTRRVGKLLERAEQHRRQARAQGPPEAIHELRVTLRRLRLLLRVGQEVLDESTVRALRQWSRRVSDAVGRVRDYDVTLQWLARQPDSAPLAGRLQAHRDRLWRAARARLAPPPDPAAARLKRLQAGPAVRQAFGKRYRKRHRALIQRVSRTAPRFFDLPLDEQHEFRRRLRQLRFLRELRLPGRKQARDPVLKRLVALQQALGEYQDCIIGGEILAQHGQAVGVEIFRQALAHEQEAWLGRIRARLKSLRKLRER